MEGAKDDTVDRRVREWEARQSKRRAQAHEPGDPVQNGETQSESAELRTKGRIAVALTQVGLTIGLCASAVEVSSNHPWTASVLMMTALIVGLELGKHRHAGT